MLLKEIERISLQYNFQAFINFLNKKRSKIINSGLNHIFFSKFSLEINPKLSRKPNLHKTN